MVAHAGLAFRTAEDGIVRVHVLGSLEEIFTGAGADGQGGGAGARRPPGGGGDGDTPAGDSGKRHDGVGGLVGEVAAGASICWKRFVAQAGQSRSPYAVCAVRWPLLREWR